MGLAEELTRALGKLGIHEHELGRDTPCEGFRIDEITSPQFSFVRRAGVHSRTRNIGGVPQTSFPPLGEKAAGPMARRLSSN